MDPTKPEAAKPESPKPNPTKPDSPKPTSHVSTKINVSWNDLSHLDSELTKAADRLEINKARELTITVNGTKENVKVQLAASGEYQNRGAKTAAVSTQTDLWMSKYECVFVSSCAFAPYSQIKGKQIKSIQCNYVRANV